MLFVLATAGELLALNTFLAPLPLAGFWIMLTYCAVQLSIVRGLMLHETVAESRPTPALARA